MHEANLFGGDADLEWDTMQLAGKAVADAAIRDLEEIQRPARCRRLLVLAGKGHNGGDALIAARQLLIRFADCRADLFFPLGQRALRPLTAKAYREMADQGERARVLRRTSDIAASYDLLLDGVFGFQFRPPLDALTAALFQQVEGLEIALRAAVDLPSGLGHADALRADFTYATGSVKTPVLQASHRSKVGRLRYIDLGFFRHQGPGQQGQRILTSDLLYPLRKLRPADSDKRTFGHVFLLGGSRSYPGAIMMATQAAVRSGAGLVTCFVPESLAPAFAAQLPEAMWVGWPETPEGTLALEGMGLWRERSARATALVMGPGLDQNRETLALCVELAKSSPVPLVLDADALQREIVNAAPRQRCIITPHAGEFRRVGGGGSPLEFVHQTGVTLVLKGPVTQVVTAARGDPVVLHSVFGGPVLARGGSGDLLAGLIGGVLAREPSAPAAAACRAVVWHGVAADLLARECGQNAVRTTQLLDFLPEALRS